MTQRQFSEKVREVMKTGAAIMPDGSQLVYHDGRYDTERFYSVYDIEGNCVDSAYSPINLYYLFR